MPEFQQGDSVRYKPVGGPDSHSSESVGVIRQVRTAAGNMTNRNVEASAEDPRYEIENKHTGKKSAIRESNIIGPEE